MLLVELLPTGSRLLMAVHGAAVLLIAIVAGATFGIWRGYNPAGYSAGTFLEMHQGAVRGLNVLLPAIAAAAIVLSVILAMRRAGDGGTVGAYGVAIVLMIAGGLVTRLANQPINALVMGWTPETMPSNWSDIRATWWTWHVVRTAITVGASATLLYAVLSDRGT